MKQHSRGNRPVFVFLRQDQPKMNIVVKLLSCLLEDCQHCGRTCVSFMMHNDAQCDFGNFEGLADF